MIFDNIKNYKKYADSIPELKPIFEFFLTADEKTEPGKHILSDKSFVNVFKYQTAPREEGSFENHKKYADIHFVISGIEEIDIADESKGKLSEDSYEKEDYGIYSFEKKYSTLVLEEGDFAVVYPDELHRPGIASEGKSADVFKAVGKLLV